MGNQAELELKPMSTEILKPVATAEDLTRLQNMSQESLAVPEGRRLPPASPIVPPEAPTPQTRSIVGGVAKDSAAINPAELKQASANIKQLMEGITPERLAQMKNLEMTDVTRALLLENEAKIDAEFAAKKKGFDTLNNVIDCIAQGIT
jgi:hypothetical protein